MVGEFDKVFEMIFVWLLAYSFRDSLNWQIFSEGMIRETVN